MKKIALDANFLIDCFKFKINFLEELNEKIGKYELFVPTSVMKELEEIAKSRGRSASYAKIALRSLKEQRIRTTKSIREKADEELKRLGIAGFVVATNDRELRKELKNLGIKTIYLRARKRLEID